MHKTISSEFQNINVFHDHENDKGYIEFKWRGNRTVEIAFGNLRTNQRTPFLKFQFFLIFVAYKNKKIGVPHGRPFRFALSDEKIIAGDLYHLFKGDPPPWLEKPFPDEEQGPKTSSAKHVIPRSFKGTEKGGERALEWTHSHFAGGPDAISIFAQTENDNDTVELVGNGAVENLRQILVSLARQLWPDISIDNLLEINPREVVISDSTSNIPSKDESLVLEELLRDLGRGLVADLQKQLEFLKWGTNQRGKSLEIAGEITDERLGKTRRYKNIESALARYARSHLVLLLGEAGSGKSFTARAVTLKLSEEHDHADNGIPVFLSLRDWEIPNEAKEDWNKTALRESLENFICGELCSLLLDRHQPALLGKYFRSLVRNLRFLFVFDGLDEIDLSPNRKTLSPDELEAHSKLAFAKVSETVQSFLELQPCNRGVLVTRPDFRPPFTVRSEVTVLRSIPLSEHQARDFIIESTGRSPIEISRCFNNNSELRRLGHTPLLTITLAAYLDARKERDSNVDITGLFRNFFKSNVIKTIKDNPQSVTQPTETDIEQTAVFLANLMYDRQQFSISHQDLLEACSVTCLAAAESLKSVGFLRKNANEIWSFAHQRWAEYFMVESLHSRKIQPDFEELGRDSRWHGMLSLFLNSTDQSQAENLAMQCWLKVKEYRDETKKNSRDRRQKSLLWMGLMIEGLEGRAGITKAINAELVGFITEKLENAPERTIYFFHDPKQPVDLEWAILAVRAISLCEAPYRGKLLTIAAKWDFNLLYKDTVCSARLLPQCPAALEREFIKSCSWPSLLLNLFQKQKYQLDFGVGKALRPMRKLQRLLIREAYCVVLSSIIWVAAILLFLCGHASEYLEGFWKWFFFMWSLLLVGFWIDLFFPRLLKKRGKSRGLLGTAHSTRSRLILVGFSVLALVYIHNDLTFATVVLLTGSLVLFPFRIEHMICRGAYHLRNLTPSAAATGSRAIGKQFLFFSMVISIIAFWYTLHEIMLRLGWNWIPLTRDLFLDSLIYGTVGTFIIAFILPGSRKTLLGWYADYRNRENLEVGKVMSRHKISEIFMNQKTARGRLSLAKQLKKTCTEVHGEWPNGIPFIEDDEASLMLYELDQIWTDEETARIARRSDNV